MKPSLFLIPLLLALVPAARSATITFGSDDFTVDTGSTGLTVSSQTSSSLSLSGDLSSGLYGTLVQSVDLSGFDFSSSIDLSAYTTSSVTGQFTVTLFDTDGDSASYTGSWTSFQSPSLVVGSLAFSSYDLSGGGTFDGSIASIGIYGTDSSIAFTLDSLAIPTVPEPAACAALAGAAILGVALWRRRLNPRR